MDVFEAITTRRSIRLFQDRPVERELIEKIVDGGRHAPSACNIQGARFIVISDDKEKRMLIDNGVRKLKDTPVGIFVLYDNRTHNPEYFDHIQSGAAAIQNMLLYAHALGLGAVWIEDLPPQRKMRELLSAPWNMSVIGMVRLGYSNQTPKSVERKYDIATVCSFGINSPKDAIEEKQSRVAWSFKKVIRRIYTTNVVHRLVLALARYFPVKFREKVKSIISRKHEKT